MLTIDSKSAGLLVIAGRLDASQCGPAQAALDKVDGVVTLDCTSLEYISSAGLGVLLKTQKRLTGAGGKLRLTGVSRHLQDIFLYSGFDQIFEIEPAR
jgi:anti-sigma B factor antagonist